MNEETKAIVASNLAAAVINAKAILQGSDTTGILKDLMPMDSSPKAIVEIYKGILSELNSTNSD